SYSEYGLATEPFADNSTNNVAEYTGIIKALEWLLEKTITTIIKRSTHHPSFKSCMIRIPGSHNFKLVQKNNNDVANESKVKIIQKWDGIRPKFNPLLYHFNIWLADKRIKEINELQSMNRDNRKRKYNNNSSHSG